MRRNQRTFTCFAISSVFFICISPFQVHGEEKPSVSSTDAEPKVNIEWGSKIPMRDGVELNATVYRPHGEMSALPAVFTLTPYIGDTYHERAMYFAQHGYVFLLVDERGRGGSQGQFEPFANDASDGYDIVEFLARQPWCNGKAAMWGGSYAGFDQWATAKGLPPHLATIVPAAAAHAGVDIPFNHGVFSSDEMQWLTLVSGTTGNFNLYGDSSFWISKYRELYLNKLPYERLDQIVGNTQTAFQKWLKHPIFDEYWQQMVPTRDQYARLNLPILTITSSYDGDQPGALAYYVEHMKYGNSNAVQKHYLVIGPWDHAGTRTPKKEVGGLTFGDASLLDLNDLHRQWFDWTMKTGEKPKYLEKRVAYYVMGPDAEKWKYADSLEEATKDRRLLYLTSDGGRANSVYESGRLAETQQSSQPDHYVYNPADLRPAELEREEVRNYLTDQRYALNLFDEGVVYHSQPLPEATELSGFVTLRLWISMDVPDTDISATLYEIMPDGTSVELTSDQMRARYRETVAKETLVPSNTVLPYDFAGFTWFSRRLSKGSRLRLVVSAINSIYFEKNYNSGKPVATESGKDARIAHVTLYHDAAHPNVLDLPIGK
jgi:putative CocE/NonD family hydrolase